MSEKAIWEYLKTLDTSSSGGGGDAGHVELTQAEYDALTQAEKENGSVYFVTDGVPTPSDLADYVVEQGASGDAHYRKWNSGIAECWITTSQSVALNNSYGQLYQGTWIWNFPITFASTPTVVCSDFQWGTSASWGATAGASTTWASLRGVDAYTRASGTTRISAYAIGRWK